MLDDLDDLFEDVVRMVCQYDRASASLIQRRLSIGYARAARIIDQLENKGVISSSDGSSKPREVLVKNADEFLKKLKLKKTISVSEKIEKLPDYTPKMAKFLPPEIKKIGSVSYLPLGQTKKKKFEFVDFSKIGNLIIVGNVISKKVEFIQNYFVFLLSKFKPEDIRLLIYDNTSIYKKYDFLPYLLNPVINDIGNMSGFRWLMREIERRIVLINKNEKEKLPVIVAIANSYISGVEMDDAIKRISSIGAYANVYMVLINDSLVEIPKMIRDNIPARLVFDEFGKYKANYKFEDEKQVDISELGKKEVKKYFESVK